MAGGSGSRLSPITKGISKHLIPVYDKPMIFYPISVLMLADIREINIITQSIFIPFYKKILGDGSNYGLDISYTIQDIPLGISDAFNLCEDFIGLSDVALILGDNIFWGHAFSDNLMSAKKNSAGATIFAVKVKNPSSFGVVEFDDLGNIISIEEKPREFKSNYAVTGLYFYKNKVIKMSKSLKPSERGELEITDINNMFLEKNDISVEILGRGLAWLDTGSCKNLHQASSFVQAVQSRQGYQIACLEEIALSKKWISNGCIKSRIGELSESVYDLYVKSLIK